MTSSTPEPVSPMRHSVTVGLTSCTVSDIEEARVQAGAPEDAEVNTNAGGIPMPGEDGRFFPAAVMFTWVE